MEHMRADNINFREFITASRRTFTIPVYQRNYEWKEAECAKLFNDIETIAGASSSHFVGTIVFVTSDSNPTWSEYTVIDGQQRITTVMLLLKAIHDLTDDETIKDEIWDDYLTNKRAKEEKYRLKLKPIETDYGAWSDVIDGKAPSNTTSNLWKNYLYLKKKIDNSEHSLQDIFEAVGKLEIVYIQLEIGKENPQVIFESINSTGLSLTQGDLIRNFLLMNCKNQEIQTRLYQEYWVKIEQYLTPSAIPDFVRDYLSIKMGSLISKSAVYETFKNFFLNDYNETEEVALRELRRYAEYYHWFRSCESYDEDLNVLFSQFHELKSSVSFGFMLWLFDKCFNEKIISEQQLKESLQILICYQFRRYICKLSTSALSKVYTALPKEIGNEHDIPKKLLDILTKKVRTQLFPRNEEFRIAFINSDVYSAKLAKYTLSMLENKINPKEKVSLTQHISIEHIMPQTLSPTWKAELGKNFEQIHEQWRHTIGNLTLSGNNSALGNKTYSEKRRVFAQSNFALSRDIALSTAWHEKSIKSRADKLADLALEIWELPAKYNVINDKIEIDYSATYNIMDNIKITGEVPRSYIIDDDEKFIDSWKALFLGVLEYMYRYDRVEFGNILKNETFKNRHLAEPVDSEYTYRSKSPDEIYPGYYAETGHSAQDLVSFTQIAAETYGLQDDIFFTLKRKGGITGFKYMSKTQSLQLDFWKAFREFAENSTSFSTMFNFQKPSPQHSYAFAVGSSEYHLSLTVHSREKRIGVDIYISDNKELFRRLKGQQKQLEDFLGMELECSEATKASRIKAFNSGDIRDRDSWEQLFEWFVITTIKFKELIARFT